MDQIVDFLRGVKDSLSGMFAITEIDKEEEKALLSAAAEEKVAQKPQRPLSVQAMKRAANRNMNKPSFDSKNSVDLKERETVVQRLRKCCLYNLLFAVSVALLTDYFFFFCSNLLPSFSVPEPIYSICKLMWWMSRYLYFAVGLFFLKLFNFFWCQDIADASYRKVRGRPKSLPLAISYADLMFTLCVQCIFVLQASLVSYIFTTYFDGMFSFLASVVYPYHMMLLYALYAYDYRWFFQGLEVQHKFTYMEQHWPYFLGFGLPLYILSNIFESNILNTSIFALVYPVFIVAANEAKSKPVKSGFVVPIFAPSSRLADLIIVKGIKQLSYLIQYISEFFSGPIGHCFLYCCYPFTYFVKFLFLLFRFFIRRKSLSMFIVLLFVSLLAGWLFIFRNKYFISHLFNPTFY